MPDLKPCPCCGGEARHYFSNANGLHLSNVGGVSWGYKLDHHIIRCYKCGLQTKVYAIGGAYSVDKEYRLQRGLGWFPDEQPSPETKALVEANLGLSEWSVDVVLSHTCPLKYEPAEVFLPFIDQSKVDKSTEEWLDSIEQRLTYDKWYCGHYHTEKIIDKIEFMYESIKEFK